MTDPAGTVVLAAVVTVATAKPAPVMAAVAAACVRFTTLGTATREAATISTAARFHRSVVGAVARIWIGVPAAATAPVAACTQ